MDLECSYYVIHTSPYYYSRDCHKYTGTFPYNTKLAFLYFLQNWKQKLDEFVGNFSFNLRQTFELKLVPFFQFENCSKMNVANFVQ